MVQPTDSPQDNGAEQQVGPAVLRRLFMISVLPFLGVLLFIAAGALGLRAFAHNNSFECGAGPIGTLAATCSRYSYWLPVALGVGGLLLVMFGGASASYYAARHVGLPVLSVMQKRRRLTS